MRLFYLFILITIFSLPHKLFAQNNNKQLEVVRAQVFSNSKMLSNSEITNILSVNPEALASYEKGMKLRKAGTPMLIGGIIITVVGSGVMISGIEVQESTGISTTNSNIKYNEKYVLGALIAGVGEGLLAGGIVCRLVGRSKIRKAVNLYNSNLAYEQVSDYKLRLGIQPNGLGVSLNF